MTKYAIFLDLDGTLLAQTNALHDETLEIIQRIRALGHAVFLATGRQYYSAIPFHRALALDTPLITLNGGAIYHPSGELLFQATLCSDFLQHYLTNSEMMQYVNATNFETPNCSLLTIEDPRIHYFLHAQMPDSLTARHQIVPHSMAEFSQIATTANLYCFPNPQKADDYYAYLAETPFPNVDYRIWEDQLNVVEFFPKATSKATAISWVLEHLDLADHTTMAFGDGINDIEMLHHVEHPVAMRNAIPQLLAAFPETTPLDHTENGVGAYLAAFFDL